MLQQLMRQYQFCLPALHDFPRRTHLFFATSGCRGQCLFRVPEEAAWPLFHMTRHANGHLCPMREGWRGAFSLPCTQDEKLFRIWTSGGI